MSDEGDEMSEEDYSVVYEISRLKCVPDVNASCVKPKGRIIRKKDTLKNKISRKIFLTNVFFPS